MSELTIPLIICCISNLEQPVFHPEGMVGIDTGIIAGDLYGPAGQVLAVEEWHPLLFRWILWHAGNENQGKQKQPVFHPSKVRKLLIRWMQVLCYLLLTAFFTVGATTVPSNSMERIT